MWSAVALALVFSVAGAQEYALFTALKIFVKTNCYTQRDECDLPSTL